MAQEKGKTHNGTIFDIAGFSIATSRSVLLAVGIVVALTIPGLNFIALFALGGIFVAASLVALLKRDIIKNKLFEQPFNNRIDSLRAEFNTLIQGNPIEPELLGYVAVNQFSSIYEVIDEIQNLSKSSLLNPSDREKVEKLLEQIKAYVVFPNSETLKKIKDTQGELHLMSRIN